MKKRVLLAYGQFNLAGTENFILGLIRQLPPDEYEIDLFLTHRSGDNLKNLPPHVRMVNLFDIDYAQFEKDYTEIANRSSVTLCLKQRRPVRAAIVYGKKFFLGVDPTKPFEKLLAKLDRKTAYDFAVCVEIRDSFLLRVVSMLHAEKKYVWVHMPFRYNNDRGREGDRFLIKYNLKPLTKYLTAYSKIVCVSEDIRDLVGRALPGQAEKTVTSYNPLDAQAVLTKAAEQPAELPYSRPLIVTVGRACREKGYELTMEAALRIKQELPAFSWVIIGGGDLLPKLRQACRKRGLESNVYFVGQKENPYPYIKAADIYCQTSRFEAYSTTINEARILKKAIVATDFIGIREQIENGVSGLITRMNGKDIAAALLNLIRQPEMRTKIEENVSYPNERERQAVKARALF